MALFNYATKEITLKIVYYGPGLSGKTTNIEHLHANLDPDRRGKLLSLSTEADRTLFFDFLPVEIGKIKDFSIRFQLYTVPGQVRYNSTRKLVLKGADAIVFVADSQREMREQNIESFDNMKENLIVNDLEIEDIPVVFQYNKRDLPNVLALDELNNDLNMRNDTYFEGIAIDGKGVEETFQAITKQLLKHIAKKHRIDVEAKDLKPPEHVREKPALAAAREASDLEKEIGKQSDFEEPVLESQATPSDQEHADLEEMPSLEDLEQEVLETAYSQEKAEPLPDDGGLDEFKLAGKDAEETPAGQMEGLQSHADFIGDSTGQEFEVETNSVHEDVGLDSQEPEVKFEDDSIESIYKAFMSEEEGKHEIPAAPVEPQIPSSKPLKAETAGIDESERELLKDFSDSFKPSSKEELKEVKKNSSTEGNRFASVIEPSRKERPVSDHTPDLIIGEINSLSKTVGKVNNSLSSLRAQLNMLSDKITDIENRLSRFSDQTETVISSIREGSESKYEVSDEIIKTVLELKRTIQKAKKRKFWMLFT